jgi:DNA-binding winged helix-turn-helix (wHTH) protein/tetratricopeptide (TPR) repeat protein
MKRDDVSPVRIDADNEWVWCGQRRLTLMPKAFAVLRHLVEHAGRLVTKEALLAAVWRDAVVSDAALASCIRDLRKALGDSPESPRYIQTVHRRGFRFIGPVTTSSTPSLTREGGGAGRDVSEPSAPATLVGRQAELARLDELLNRALKRQRQLVFVTGEPGIGKTALVEAFIAQNLHGASLLIGHGRCVEHYGAGEAYLPVLEALGRLGREAGGERLARFLRQHAPTWLAQLPGLLVDEDLAAVQRRASGASRERMLRELVEALDALTVDAALVLVLEDLHWSDSATIDLLAMLARRREASRLLVLGTYRPADLAVSDHPLKTAKRELQLHGQCEEIALDFLGVDAVAEYLRRRFGQPSWLTDLARMLHRRTDGNPLFLVNTVDLLLAQGQLHEANGQWVLSAPVRDLALEAPATLAQLVEKQIERLTPDEQAMLEIASVAGAEFSAAIAAAHGIDAQEAERSWQSLARRGQFVRATGVAEWPNGTVAGRYAFIHALYQHVLYGRIPVGRRVGLHLRTGQGLEQGHGERTADIAGELAMHFAQGRDFGRAARYHHLAGQHALSRHGYREAADHLAQALDALDALPDSEERTQQALTLHAMHGSALAALKGHAVPEVEHAFARARELSARVEDSPRLIPVLLGLGRFYLVRGLLDATRDVGMRLLSIAEASGDPSIVAAHDALAAVSFYSGEFEPSLAHAARVLALYDPAAASSASRLIVDSGMSASVRAAWTRWILGYPAQASVRMREAVALAQATAHPFSLAHAHRFAAAFHQTCREPNGIHEHAEAAFAVAREHEFAAVIVAADFHRGSLLVDRGRADEGLALMRAWVKTCRDIRSECLIPPYLAWLAETCGALGRGPEGLDLVGEGLAAVTQSGNHYWTAELYRVRGALTKDENEAESSLLEAIAIARRQHAKSFELRATAALSRLWARQGRARDAHAELATIYAWFTEGLDTPDLRDARTLLAELERPSPGRKKPGRRG